ncbi:hypothetical protein [Marinobacter sp.]|uniref:hypothetical protein n=1 Tax=Marinobacter sp. TaxID=50741 RepID=UPI0034A26928
MGMDVPVTSLGTSKERLEELKALKGRLSRQVEDARQQGANADGRISELQAITSEIKQLQKALKQQLNNAAVAEKWVPPHIAMPSSIGHRLIEGPVEVRVCTSAFVALADAYVGNHAAGSVWHRPQVTDFVRQTFGHKTRYLCAFDESRNIVGVLPIVQLCSRLFGNFLVSVPYFNYGGLLADNADVAGNLLEAGSQWREDLGARHLELRFSQDHGLGLPKRTDKVTFWLPLPDNTGDLWRSFQPKNRAHIRRGER